VSSSLTDRLALVRADDRFAPTWAQQIAIDLDSRGAANFVTTGVSRACSLLSRDRDAALGRPRTGLWTAARPET
jgi:hypothetical protein